MDPDTGTYIHFLLLSDTISSANISGQIVLFFLFIGISFLVSGAEVAFFSLTKAEIEDFRHSQTGTSQRIWRLFSQPQRLLATILISNNLANVAAILVGSSAIQQIAELQNWQSQALDLGLFDVSVQFLLDVLVITSIILFLGEIVPKVYATKNRILLVQSLSLPLDILSKIFYPLSWLLIRTTSFLQNSVNVRNSQTSLEDLKQAIDITKHNGSDKEKDEQEILRGIVNFSNIPVKSIMKARVDVIAIDLSITWDDLLELINNHNFSRFPVYEDNLDNIRGVLHIKDLLPFVRAEGKNLNLVQLLRPVHFVPESKKIDDLLEDFKRQRLHLAVVVDEYGGTAGIVTLEDVIEEIFGEIHDEFDQEDWIYTKIDEETFIFEGRISLNDVRKIVGLNDEVFEDARGDSDSLGGLILELHGKIPNPGEIISYQNIDLQVEAVSKTRITMVKFILNREVETHT